MARSKQKVPHYCLEEPVTGLYIAPGAEARLTRDPREAAHFTLVDAALASSELAALGTPHGLVRVEP